MQLFLLICFFFFSSRRRHTRWNCDWSSDVCSSDLFAVGEHHRLDMAVSATAVVLAAIAAATGRIRLASAVTILSTADPVLVFEEFATVDLISGGRAEI